MNNKEINITNLGKIKQANIKIRPLTILAGTNGTGKTFLNKSLYSIFNVIHGNVLHTSILTNLNSIKENINDIVRKDFLLKKYNDSLIDLLKNIELIISILEENKKKFFAEYLIIVDENKKLASAIFEKINDYLMQFDTDQIKKRHQDNFIIYFILRINKDLKEKNEFLLQLFKDSRTSFENELGKAFQNELKQNFQINDLKNIVSFGQNKACLNIDNLMDIKINNKIEFKIYDEFIKIISNLSKVVFFESPTYWKLSKALILAQDEIDNDKLSDVPKYFYEINNELKNDYLKIDEDLNNLAEELKHTLNGEFNFSNGNLTFNDNQGNKIHKNLMSFGMTNLGIIQALLKKGIIQKGSFVFIDEPEINLHPEWQVLLMNTFIALAQNDVNIVISTHSLDMLKALDVHLKEKNLFNSDFISINYLKTNNENQVILENTELDPQQTLDDIIYNLTTPFTRLYEKEQYLKPKHEKMNVDEWDFNH